MKIITSLFAALLCIGVLAAQRGPMDHRPGMPSPHGVQADALKTYLSLSDDQLLRLKDVQKALREASQPIMEQIAEKSKELREALQQNPVNQALVTQLKDAMETLRKKIQSLQDQFQPQAQAILTAEQKIRLAALQKVLELIPAAQQAVFFNLLDSPSGSSPGPGNMRPRHGRGPSGLDEPINRYH